METTNKAEQLVEEAGCGPFQVVLVLVTNLIPKIGMMYAALFMVFGNYNPGWKCLDYNATFYFNSTGILSTARGSSISITTPSYSYYLPRKNFNDTANDYAGGSCELFNSCKNIEFDPSASTVVTEWRLVCDKAWVPSFIISLQMGGVVTGSLLLGHVVDAFGRKKMYNISLTLVGVLNIVAVFSPYWQMLAVVQFLLGGVLAGIVNLYCLYSAEFLNSKWRAWAGAIPGRSLGGFLFGIVVILCKDWKVLLLTNGVFFIFAFILSILWVPESLRWLEVKSKSKEFEQVAKKMMRVNKKNLETDNEDRFKLSTSNEFHDEKKVYSLVDLFRKGYRLRTFVVAFTWIVPSCVYYAITYGIKAMPGNFYINLIVLTSADIPFALLPMFIPNLIGRKKANILFMAVAVFALLTTASSAVWVSDDDKKAIALMVTLIVARVACQSLLTCHTVMSSELYPTVVRSIALGFCSLMARLGGMIAPVLIPKDSKDIVVSYGVMAATCLMCCLAFLRLPETRGKELKGEFDKV